MSDCSKNNNPLVRNGTGRHERFRKELDKNFVLPDERRFEDWIVYARNLATHVKYYNPKNEIEGNWQPFFDSDISSQLALVAVQDIADYKERVRNLFIAIQAKEAAADLDKLRKDFGQLFGAVFSLAARMDYFLGILPEDLPLRRVIVNLTLTKLAPSLGRLLGYYKAALNYQTDLGPIVTQTDDSKWSILGYPQETADAILTKGLSDKWQLGQNDWNQYFNAISNDAMVYNHAMLSLSDAEIAKVITHAVNHNLFSSVFAEFLSAYARIVREAQQQLMATITEQNTHEPHYALYLSFLHLLKDAQDEMNTYTGNHLDFYYKQILQLAPKKSEPGHVHLAMELANASQEFLLTKGTAFKAGKDSLGKEVLYLADEDTVLNKAAVTDLRSFYRGSSTDTAGTNSFYGLLYASSVANSEDGAGKKLSSESKDWGAFGNKHFEDGELNDIWMPHVRVGFAFASHYLFMKEGNRTITLTLEGANLNLLDKKKFDCKLTTEKGWLTKEGIVTETTDTTATLTIPVQPEDPAITAYVPKVHEGIFPGVDTPIIQFALQNVPGADHYGDLKDLAITSTKIRVNVGNLNNAFDTGGIKDLMVTTDMGTADPSKPFIPFGQNPKQGAGMIIGNSELFEKEGARFKLYIEWADLKANVQSALKAQTTSDDVSNATGTGNSARPLGFNTDYFPPAKLQFLQNGVWKNISASGAVQSRANQAGEMELFVNQQSVTVGQMHVPSDAQGAAHESPFNYQNPYLPFGISSRNGFMKLQLNADFGWDTYYEKLQEHYIKLANKTTTTLPTKPYLPKIQTMYLSYEATDNLGYDTHGNISRFFHLYPFGTDEVAPSSGYRLMPQFSHLENAETIHHCAEFYIGLEQALPSQKVNILFRVLDGSTNPRESKPEQHVKWSFLSQNQWIDFKSTEVNDTTRQLIETGIITFSLPAEARTDNTVLPAGKHWLRASIATLPEQVARLIDVRAQVIRATFYDQGNAIDFSQKPLPPGSIAKLHDPQPAIKKVEQPYASFGGRYPETDEQFYTRVSERLRHKNRAITIRDVEQLVLEKFTDIHQVKCLNHTRLEPGASGIYNELAPGHVTVITIPDLQNRNAINPLRPYTSLSRLQEIKQFLQAHANRHMTWHVENPEFEEIRIKTDIILTPDAAGNDTFFKNRLKDDLVGFLTPWAQTVQTDIRFGGKITQSTLINFMEERPYVDVVLNLEMYHRREGHPESGNKDEITASTARSILVSVPAKTHDINITSKN